MKLQQWTANSMMLVSVLAALVLVPAGFILSGRFTDWLKATGIHPSPNLADGFTLADFDLQGSVHYRPSVGYDGDEARRALSLRRFAVKKVAFRPWSGAGISPRLNLCFEFDDRLPDPHASPSGFSMTVIHVYIKVPGKTAEPGATDKAANLDTEGMEWNYQVIIDGLHEKARIYDTRGNLASQGLGLYVESSGTKGTGRVQPARTGTRITAALPMDFIGDPSRGEWRYYVLVGLSDSRNPSMMLHSGPNGALETYSGSVVESGRPAVDGKPRLRPLEVNNRI